MPMPKPEQLRYAVPLLLFGVLLSLIAGLAACTPYQVSDRSMNFNDALQDLDNRQVLLNAVRASKRYPPYYTAVNQISSTGELDGSQVNFSLPFGPISHNNNSVSPMIKVGTGITMQTNPLDTQDFYEGYMQPVKPDLVGYYLNYGWPRQLVVHTFVREVDLPQDIVDSLQIRLKNFLQSEQHLSCVNNGRQFTALIVGKDGRPDLENVATCLDNLSDQALLARVMSDDQTPALPEKCTSFENLNTLQAETYDLAARAGTDIVRFVNDPSDRCRFATFQLLSAMLDKLELVAFTTPVPASTSKPISVPTSQSGLSIKIQNDASASGTPKVNFGLNQVTDPCALSKGAPLPTKVLPKDTVTSTPMQVPIVGGELPSAAVEAANRAAGKPTAPGTAHPAPAGNKPAAEKPAAAPVKPKPTPAAAIEPWNTFCKDETLMKMVPRSPEAIVFYLGQVIDAENPEGGKPGFVAQVFGTSRPAPLFDVVKGGPGGAAEVSVSLDGDSYGIPRGDEFRSTMHTLTLTEQVIGLQKKGTQIPGIVPVQVINP